MCVTNLFCDRIRFNKVLEFLKYTKNIRNKNSIEIMVCLNALRPQLVTLSVLEGPLCIQLTITDYFSTVHEYAVKNRHLNPIAFYRLCSIRHARSMVTSGLCPTPSTLLGYMVFNI